MNTLKAGDKVWFGRGRGQKTLATVEKVNPKTVLVVQDEPRGQHPVGTRWRVEHSMVSPTREVGYFEPLPRPVRPEQEVLREILDCYAGLSLENLTCDGMRSPAEAARRRAHLQSVLGQLQKELGRKVSEMEAYRLTRA